MHTPQLNATETSLNYAQSVLKGELIAGNYVKLACKRFLDDIEHAQEKGIRWDAQAAQRKVNFFGTLKHWKGRTDGFRLLPWEVFIVANLFGWKKLSDGYRRFREAYIEIGRKNGKSHLAAGIGLVMLVDDSEPGAEIVSAACSRDQAYEVFKPAKMMASGSALLAREGVNVQRAAINVLKTNSMFIPVSSEAKNLEGKNIHCAIIDELHRHPDDTVYNVLTKSTVSRNQPLVLSITTAGVYNPECICWICREYATKTLEGVLKVDSLFAYIATLDKDDDWTDEKNWYKANPSLGEALRIEDLRPGAARAKESPSQLNDFKTKHLNIWTEQKQAWLAPEVWAKNSKYPDDPQHRPTDLRAQALKKLEGRRCYGGVDMGESIDLTALALVFPPCEQVTVDQEITENGKTKTQKVITQEADDKWSVIAFHWYPSNSVQEQEKKKPGFYSSFVRGEFINVIDGPTINPEAIRNTVRDTLMKKYRIKEIGYDPAGADAWLAPQLQKDGVNMVKLIQRTENMSLPCEKFMNLLIAGHVEHYNDPLLRWEASNVQLYRDTNGNVKPDKGKSGDKIDGIVATIMAMNRAMANPVATNEDDPNRFKVQYI